HLFDGTTHAQVRLSRIFWMDSSLHTHFCRTALPCLLRSSHYFVQPQIIGGTTQILAQFPFREGTELAAEIADVGVVDISIYYIAHHVPIDTLPQFIGRFAHRCKLVSPCLEESHNLAFCQIL